MKPCPCPCSATDDVVEDEPRDTHPLSCAVWKSQDPCDCPDPYTPRTPGGLVRSQDRIVSEFEASVDAEVARFERYGVERGES